MIRIVKGDRERVAEHRRSLFEADAVFSEIGRRFLAVPF